MECDIHFMRYGVHGDPPKMPSFCNVPFCSTVPKYYQSFQSWALHIVTKTVSSAMSRVVVPVVTHARACRNIGPGTLPLSSQATRSATSMPSLSSEDQFRIYIMQDAQEISLDILGTQKSVASSASSIRSQTTVATEPSERSSDQMQRIAALLSDRDSLALTLNDVRICLMEAEWNLKCSKVAKRLPAHKVEDQDAEMRTLKDEKESLRA